MLALRPDAVLMCERHRVLDEMHFDAADRVHLGADDPRRFLATVCGIRSNPTHRVDVGAAELAFPHAPEHCGPTSPTAEARWRIPARNASGKLCNDRCESPSAWSPSYVNPTLTVNPVPCSARRALTRSDSLRNQSRAFAPSLNLTKRWRPYRMRMGATTLS